VRMRSRRRQHLGRAISEAAPLRSRTGRRGFPRLLRSPTASNCPARVPERRRSVVGLRSSGRW
jgi:hypothetical protein